MKIIYENKLCMESIYENEIYESANLVSKGFFIVPTYYYQAFKNEIQVAQNRCITQPRSSTYKSFMRINIQQFKRVFGHLFVTVRRPNPQEIV